MNRLNRRVSRRRAVQAGAGLSGLALGFPLVRAYAQDATATPGASPVSGTIIESSVEGVPTAYTAYPEPFKSTDGVPGKGGTVKMLTLSYSPPPTDKKDNSFWQELEKRLGVTWDASLVPVEGYNERLATTLAGGDLPDFFYLLPSATRPQIYDAIQQGAFYDLTEIVESDKIKDYPNLAAYPKYMWDATKFEGKVWGVPKPVLRNNDPAYHRADWVSKLGSSLTDAKGVRDFLVGVSKDDPDGNGDNNDTFGLAPYGGGWDSFLLNQIFKVPYGWRKNDDGTLTNAIESDEYREALEYMVGLYKDGAYHPDAAALDVTAAVDLMKSGRTGMASNGFAAVFGPTGFRSTILETVPDAKLEPLVLPGKDGGEGCTYQSPGIFGYVALPAAADEERIHELLSILNYLCAPFGSEEATFLMFGEEGKHSERTDDGGYKLTDEGRAMKSALVYPFLSENYFYYSGMPDEAIKAQKHNEAMAKVAIANPTMGLYSKTQGDKGAAIAEYMTGTFNDIVTGRKPVEYVDDMIAEWKKRGGDDIRAEYEEALKAQNS